MEHSYSDRFLGRECPPWPCVPFLSRGAGAAFAPGGVVSFDMCTAAFSASLVAAELNIEVPWVAVCINDTAVLRQI
eukprot:6146710-Pyramimonas_sp.AAC.2